MNNMDIAAVLAKRRPQLALKRLMDVVISGCALLVLWPLLLITVGRDSRVTRVGAFLRKTKLDELAQLLNVLTGEMSFVGPRPEVPKYVDLYTPYQRQVLLVRPGITDYASIAYRNENDLLEGAQDPERMYIDEIMPAKIELNMKYLHEISPLADIRLILSTVVAVIKD